MLPKLPQSRLMELCRRMLQSCGVAAELSARIAEEGFDMLKAPIRRVTSLDVPVPYGPQLEEFINPSEARIADAIRAVVR